MAASAAHAGETAHATGERDLEHGLSATLASFEIERHRTVVDESHSPLSPIVRVDDTGGVEQSDTVLASVPTAGNYSEIRAQT